MRVGNTAQGVIDGDLPVIVDGDTRGLCELVRREAAVHTQRS